MYITQATPLVYCFVKNSPPLLLLHAKHIGGTGIYQPSKLSTVYSDGLVQRVRQQTWRDTVRPSTAALVLVVIDVKESPGFIPLTLSFNVCCGGMCEVGLQERDMRWRTLYLNILA